MQPIHELSSITPVPELDLFGVPPTQLSIEKDLVTYHRPISTISSSSDIKFNIPSAIDEYIQLRDMLLQVRLKVNLKKNGDVTAADWDKVSPINYMLNTMWKQVSLEINGTQMNSAPYTYPYKSYMETLLGFTEDAKKSYLTAALWYENNTGANKHKPVAQRTKRIKPSSVATDGTGKEFELMGKLHLDMAFQNRALLGGSTIKLTLTPHDPKFYMLVDGTGITPQVELKDVVLIVHRAKVSAPVVEAHNLALRSGTAKYPHPRLEVRDYSINSGTINCTIDNVVSGTLPRRAIVALVDTAAFNGHLNKDPLYFEHFKLNQITAHLNGIQYPAKAYTPDFENGLVAPSFLGVFDTLNQLSTDSYINIDIDKYIDGFTLFGFNFAPDLSDGCLSGGHVNPVTTGTMRLDLNFKEALPKTINVLILCEYDAMAEINENREVKTDYFK